MMGGGDGSSGNPYTWDEYEYLADNDNWSGGYVEGAGYTGAQVTIQGNSSVTSNFSSYSTGYVPGINGIYANYTLNGYTSISNGIMSVGAGIYNPHGIYADSRSAIVDIYLNGVLLQTTPLTLSSSGYYSVPGTVVLGDVNINLPSGGYVEVKLSSSGIFSQYQTGYGNGSVGTYNDVIYSSYR